MSKLTGQRKPTSRVKSAPKKLTLQRSSELLNYELGDTLGQGAYGQVQLATQKQTGKKLAIKIYRKESLENQRILSTVNHEIQILQKLNSQFTISLVQVIGSKGNTYLVTDYIKGQQLGSYVKQQPQSKISEQLAKNIFIQILFGVKSFHDKCIAHRDLKLDNIMIDSEFNVKIIDFGFACSTKQSQTLVCGSLPYMAPEIIQRVKYDSVASDIWALGVILYRMLYGKLPWINRDRDTLKEKILQTDFVINDSVSSSANELISRILVKNPLKRPSIESIINDLWLSDCTFQIPTMPNSLNSSYASIARRRKQPLRRVANVLNTTARVRRGSFKKK